MSQDLASSFRSSKFHSNFVNVIIWRLEVKEWCHILPISAKCCKVCGSKNGARIKSAMTFSITALGTTKICNECHCH